MSAELLSTAELQDGLFQGRHHARFIDPDVPLHVISRVFQGRHLLRPCTELNGLIVGVVGRALARYAKVRLFAMTFLSNHAHFMLQGPPAEVPAFVGFIKREISRRWGHRADVGWRGTMWHEYVAAALPTQESQVSCLKYVLSQGVKEGLVARPEEWPGVQSTSSLTTGAPLEGHWLNATAYSRAVDAQSRRVNPRPVAKADYLLKYQVRFSPIPAWAHLEQEVQRQEAQRLVEGIVAEGEAKRAGGPPLGARAVREVPLDHRSELPLVPWLARRRRMIFWASPRAPETRRFLHAYWAFQHEFRMAATEDRKRPTRYPPGAFEAGRWAPIPDALSFAA